MEDGANAERSIMNGKKPNSRVQRRAGQRRVVSAFDDDSLDDLPIGVLIFARGQLVRINDGWSELTGLDLKRSHGDGWLEAIHDDDRALARRLVSSHFGSAPTVGDVRLRSFDGEDVWVHARSRLVEQDQRTSCIITLTEIGARKADELRLLHLATHDAMTGLMNAGAFRTTVDSALEKQHGESQIAILFVDLDRFKIVNDCFGHAFGDLVLGAVARRLETAVRPSDTVARLGGVVRHADVAHLADRVIQTVGAPCAIDGHVVSIGTSIGIAMSSRARSAAALLALADAAMYRAKAAGGSRWMLAHPVEMDAVSDPEPRGEVWNVAPDAEITAGMIVSSDDTPVGERAHQLRMTLAAAEKEVMSLIERNREASAPSSPHVVRALFERLSSLIEETAHSSISGSASVGAEHVSEHVSDDVAGSASRTATG